MGPVANIPQRDESNLEEACKYEVDPEESKTSFNSRAVMALIFGTGLGVLKNILFPDAEGNTRPKSGQADSEDTAMQAPKDAGPEKIKLLDLAALSKARNEGSSRESPDELEGSGKQKPLHKRLQPDFDNVGVPHKSGQVNNPVNDNVRLFGAPPGSRIALPMTAPEIAGDLFAPPVQESRGGGAGTQSSSSVPDEGQGGTGGGGPPAGSGEGTGTQTRVNRAPVVTGPVRLPGLGVNQQLVIGLGALLTNTTDADADVLSIKDLAASSGKLESQGNNKWIFTPVEDDTSGVTFSYSVSDGEADTAQTAVLDLLPHVVDAITGTDGEDTLIGTPASDSMLAFAGNDVVLGREGNDRIDAGEGDDRVVGGSGDDIIFGGPGNDVIFGGEGNDVIFGGKGDDTLFGDEGDDVLAGEEGNDTLFGGEGNDKLIGASGDDLLLGEAGDDLLDGGDGNDKVEGGDGDDTIIAGAGEDVVLAGGGDDEIIAMPGDGNDTYDGGEGVDTYNVSATSAPSVIDLVAGTASSADFGEDTIKSVENVIASAGNDIIVANSSTNIMMGGAGNDTFVFRSSDSSGKGSGSRDKILDLEVGDRIKLDDIDRSFADAYEDTFKDQGIEKFVLIGQMESFTKPGQLRLAFDQIDGKEITIVQGNIDAVDDVDFEIELAGHIYLTSDDDTDYWHYQN